MEQSESCASTIGVWQSIAASVLGQDPELDDLFAPCDDSSAGAYLSGLSQAVGMDTDFAGHPSARPSGATRPSEAVPSWGPQPCDRGPQIVSGTFKQLQADLELLEAIGKGAGGKAVRAIRRRDGTELVVKVIDLVPAHMQPHNSADAWQEVAVMSMMRHPHIVRYYGCYSSPDAIYVVMEFCSGGDLAGFLKSATAPLTERQVLSIFTQVRPGRWAAGLGSWVWGARRGSDRDSCVQLCPRHCLPTFPGR